VIAVFFALMPMLLARQFKKEQTVVQHKKYKPLNLIKSLLR